MQSSLFFFPLSFQLVSFVHLPFSCFLFFFFFFFFSFFFFFFPLLQLLLLSSQAVSTLFA